MHYDRKMFKMASQHNFLSGGTCGIPETLCNTVKRSQLCWETRCESATLLQTFANVSPFMLNQCDSIECEWSRNTLVEFSNHRRNKLRNTGWLPYHYKHVVLLSEKVLLRFKLAVQIGRHSNIAIKSNFGGEECRSIYKRCVNRGFLWRNRRFGLNVDIFFCAPLLSLLKLELQRNCLQKIPQIKTLLLFMVDWVFKNFVLLIFKLISPWGSCAWMNSSERRWIVGNRKVFIVLTNRIQVHSEE